MADARLKVLLVTSDREKCGIREYSWMLMEALGQVALDIKVDEWPHPHRKDLLSAWSVFKSRDHDILHLNHHAALHASWTPESLRDLREIYSGIVVTQHDTLETWDLMRERSLPDFTRAASAVVFHEPVVGLPELESRGGDGLKHLERLAEKVYYIRQGVLPLPEKPYEGPIIHGVSGVVGSVGFPFPWKNYDLLCSAALKANWGVLLIAPDATEEQERAWQKLNPAIAIVRDFLPRWKVVQLLAACDATAFLYQTGNTGTSAAIRLGIAAGRPLLAFRCRQFRDLYGLPGIRWLEDELDLVGMLNALHRFPEDCTIYRTSVRELAEQDSWANVAWKYAAIYREIACSR